MKDSDTVFMDKALELARAGEGLVSPNPLVGAVIVKDDRIAGEGFHLYERLKHAESYALEAAGESARGAVLYCSLEPCCHQGRTSPCTDAIIESGLARVVIAIEDPDPRVNGKGIRLLMQAGIEVDVGLRAEEARRQNECYIKHISTKIPFAHLILPPSDGDNWRPSQDLLGDLFRYDALVVNSADDAGKAILNSFISRPKHRRAEVIMLEEAHKAASDDCLTRSAAYFNTLDKERGNLSAILELAKERGLTSLAIIGDSVLRSTAELDAIDKITAVRRDDSIEEPEVFSWNDRRVVLLDPKIVATKGTIEVTGYPG